MYYVLDSGLGFNLALSIASKGKVLDFAGLFLQPAQCSSQFNVTITSAPGVVDVPVMFYKFGPIVNGKYDYAVYGRGDGSTVAIDARDPETFAVKYEKEVVLNEQSLQIFEAAPSAPPG